MGEVATGSGLAALGARFATRLPGRAADLAALAEGLAPGQPAAALDPLRVALHSLAGSAPTLGFVRVGTCARKAEDRVLAHRGGEPLCAGAVADVRAALAPVLAACAAGAR